MWHVAKGPQIRLRAIDLCCGAGGWACAARETGISILHAYDIWPTACETYKLNHPDTQVHQCDLTKGLPNDPRPVDVVLGAIPCGWISSARGGNKAGAAEIARERALLDAVLEIVRKLNPRYWCLEDLVQLRRELPPLTPYRVLDAHALGYSVQARKRLFVGHFPKVSHSPVEATPTCVYLNRGPYFLTDHGRLCRVVEFSRRSKESPSRLRVGIRTGDSRLPTVLCWSNRHKNTAPVILDPAIPGGRRELEFAEAARLQGFPENYVFCGDLTSAWRQVADAVQINLARAICRAICEDK